MFTGLVAGTGVIQSQHLSPTGGGILSIANHPWENSLNAGESIAVNGVCLTVVRFTRQFFEVDVSQETFGRTNLGDLSIGSVVNLERALCLGDRLGGHLVLGHVDGQGLLRGIEKKGNFIEMDVDIPDNLERYVVEKGSIALDGISLTIAKIVQNRIRVAIIPTTWNETNLHLQRIGYQMNVEVDILAKHVEKLLGFRTIKKSEINRDFLAEHGFL